MSFQIIFALQDRAKDLYLMLMKDVQGYPLPFEFFATSIGYRDSRGATPTPSRACNLPYPSRARVNLGT